MKLYLYDHCPYCVRADMVARYKDLDIQNVYLANDDEQSCFDLIGAKMVPILEVEGSAQGESLDIVKRLDDMGSQAKVIRAGGQAQPVLDRLNQVDFAINCLLFPRSISIGLPEFQTESAQQYFEAKKERIIDMPFTQALAQTTQYIAEVETALAQLPPLELPSAHQNSISWDDVLIYPTLRNLTMVKGLTFPENVLTYLHDVALVTKTHTYFDKAM